MVDLSVGEVSGLIAAGVFILQLVLSVAFPAALVGFVGDENTAVTWSVLGRLLQSSPWPTLLQTDSAARHGVRRRVSYGLLLQTAIVTLVSVAAIVTPLGLYQTVEPAGSQDLEALQFVKDDSPFGYGTPARMVAPFTRSCGEDACPGSSMNQTCVQQGLLLNCTDVVYDRSIPDIWMSTFTDGARQVNQSVSSIFDIQWRTQVNASDAFGSQGWYVKSGYRQIGILILDPGIHLVDGLIVDAQTGGIGFRNHTTPAPVHEYGSTWTEDILFIEPDTQCVDLNVTFDFYLTQNNTSRLAPRNLSLTDRGGFSQLARKSPDLSVPVDGNGQGPLDLRERAYKAAWANNFFTLAYFNATGPDPSNITRFDVTPGMKFNSSGSAMNSSGEVTSATFFIDYQSIRSTLFYGDYLDFSGSPTERNASASNATGNPFGISLSDFVAISEICAGSFSSSPANINSSMVGCGLVYGAARRTDGGSEFSPQPGSQWSIPVYSCAASVHATIRTVTFKYNGTGLAALNVTAATPKSYASPSDIPLWAVEDMHTTTLASAQPLWGLLGPANATIPPALAKNLTTVQQPTLRLPGTLNPDLLLINGPDYIPAKEGQNLPGVDFYAQALQNAFAITRPGAVGYEGYADYSGLTSLALYTKWRYLSATAAGAAQIINLVWTDIAANSVVGTRGWTTATTSTSTTSSSDTNTDTNNTSTVKVPVTPYTRRVRYRLPYAVPAILVLALSAAVLATAAVLLALGRTGAGKMRRLLDATSAGRIMGGFLWGGKEGVAAAAAVAGERKVKTDEWVRTVGKRAVSVRIVNAAAGGSGEEDNGEGDNGGNEKGRKQLVIRAVPGEGELGEEGRLMGRL
ncbi:977e06de-1174-4cee-afc6-2ce7c3bfd637 [Thermothielavioides terrestris]|uniref:977e06de-1174-4cee-afc6-2ce7c3bfd637 n=1 Tax=Thermothielavioides terrestris TaxID=2587410 RepID=A0A3S4F2F9_9PEZI|nr:977e06de-1174-4cee-afc6-2ce7c3bfd637 [Thermothielavioides terrestris]